MSAEWPRVQISDACDLIVDCVNKTAPRVDHATPYKMIRTPNIRNGRIDLTDCRFVERETFEKWTRRAKVERDDVLLTREAPMGEVGLVDFDDTVFLGQRIMQYRVNRSILLPRFLLYLFLSPDLQNQFRMHDGTGSVVSHIRVPDCSKFELNLPPLAEQERITAILGSLDDKIQLNHQINQTLEQMAQAIFKSWFVDFEPVKAKIAALEAGGSEEDALLAAMRVIAGDAQGSANAAGGTTPGAAKGDKLTRLQAEQPEQYAELRATAELFPSALQDSELGEIPEGWAYGTLSDIASLSSNRIPKHELTLETYISTENMLENKKGVCPASSLPSSASVPGFEPGEILISNIRPYFKKIWLANISGGRSPDVLGFSPEHTGTNEYLFNLLYQDGFFEHMMLTSKGAKMPRGDKKAIMQFTTVVPPIDLMRHFSGRVMPFYALATSQNRESDSLILIRDAILPKLLSGELALNARTDRKGFINV